MSAHGTEEISAARDVATCAGAALLAAVAPTVLATRLMSLPQTLRDRLRTTRKGIDEGAPTGLQNVSDASSKPASRASERTALALEENHSRAGARHAVEDEALRAGGDVVGLRRVAHAAAEQDVGHYLVLPQAEVSAHPVDDPEEGGRRDARNLALAICSDAENDNPNRLRPGLG